MKIDCPIPPQVLPLRLRQQSVTQMECRLKRNVTQNGMPLKMESHSKWNVPQNGMSVKIECHS